MRRLWGRRHAPAGEDDSTGEGSSGVGSTKQGMGLLALFFASFCAAALYFRDTHTEQSALLIPKGAIPALAAASLAAPLATAAAASLWPQAPQLQPLPAYRACLARQGPAHAVFLTKRLAASDFGYLEMAVLDTWARLVAGGAAPPPALILDVGANVGQSAQHFFSLFPAAPHLQVHSFELSAATYALLARSWRAAPPQLRARWHLRNEGVSSARGVSRYSPGKGAGDERASLGQHRGNSLQHTHSANVTTIAEVLAGLGWPEVDLLKIDVEGHECDVLVGAGLEAAAAGGRIKALLFEYSAHWVDRVNPIAGAATLPIHDLVDRLDGYGYECFYHGRGDMVRVTRHLRLPPSGAEVDIVGFSPNVLCLRRDAALSRLLVGAHCAELRPCAWWEEA